MIHTKRKAGVVLSGCGYLDGSEVREAVLTLLALDRHDFEAVCIAPKKPQQQVVDHQTGEAVEDERRDVLRESARIARGDVRELATVKAAELDVLLLPGGFGVAKNLSNFASKGANAVVDERLAGLLRAMHASNKPIGAICIAPAVVAAVLGKETEPLLTVGDDADTAAKLEAMGAIHRASKPDECVIDEANRIVSTGAYMFDARLRDIAAGIDALVAAIAAMLPAGAQEVSR